MLCCAVLFCTMPISLHECCNLPTILFLPFLSFFICLFTPHQSYCSDDLPLNVGREILQQSRALRIIKQRLVKKSVEMMTDLAATNTTAYDTFFKNFGKYIKVGIIEDEKAKEDLVPLCRFFSSASVSVVVCLFIDLTNRRKQA